jgi:hypothetical protein
MNFCMDPDPRIRSQITDPGPYKHLRIFDIKVSFLVVLESKEIQKYMWPCQKF